MIFGSKKQKKISTFDAQRAVWRHQTECAVHRDLGGFLHDSNHRQSDALARVLERKPLEVPEEEVEVVWFLRRSS